MSLQRPVTEIVSLRFSCRAYLDTPVAEQDRTLLGDRAQSLREGPFGTPLRFRLVAATAENAEALKGLRTYGMIRGANAFLVGAMSAGDHCLEDYGYAMEQLVLFATDLGLGTCWLGGSFTRSTFSRAIEAGENERVPAVAAVGRIPDAGAARAGVIRRRVGADFRLPWESLFFEGELGVPLPREKAGDLAVPLEMLRWGPSASNKQPWRVVRCGSALHFFLQRTAGYRGGLAGRLLRLEDIQRVDMGIAMCHFELAAREIGLPGKWVVRPPAGDAPEATEYTATWESEKIAARGRRA